MAWRILMSWLGMMGLAIANGVVRDGVYRVSMGDLAAHQLSTLTLLVLFTVYFWALFRGWRLTSAHQAWGVGTAWLIMTLAFEFGFGRFTGQSWSALWHAYRLDQG